MSRISRPSTRVLGGLVVCCVLGLAAACSDSNNGAPAGEAPTVETAPPPAEDPGLQPPPEEMAPPEADPSMQPGEEPAPEEGAIPEEAPAPEGTDQ
jgi:hypothetical protein